MLAYVFWHWRQPTVTEVDYETHLTAFQSVLTANPSPGFQSATVFKLERASWLNTRGAVYEDWYVVNDSAALDPLNAAAVSGACEVPHHLVAREAADGTAGLYRWRDGVKTLRHASFATWLSKPAGVSYGDFYKIISSLLEASEGSLWGRQMTLGPTKEFCIHTNAPLVLPDTYISEKLSLTQIWPHV